MYGQKKKFSTFSYKLVQISPIMILVNSGAFLSYFFVKKYLLVGASSMLWTGQWISESVSQ